MHSNEIRQQVIADMKMAGLSLSTQRVYLGIMDRFVRTTWAAPEQVSETMLRDHLRSEIERGVARGTFQPIRYALKFLFHNTLRRDWDLFKKESRFPSVSDCLMSFPTRNAASCSLASAIRSIGPVFA